MATVTVVVAPKAVTSEEGEGDQLLPTTTGGETTCNNQLQFKVAVGEAVARPARRQRQHGGRGGGGGGGGGKAAQRGRRRREGWRSSFFCQLLLLSCSLWRHIIFYHIHMGIRSVCTYLRTYVVCLWSVNVGKRRHKSEPTH